MDPKISFSPYSTCTFEHASKFGGVILNLSGCHSKINKEEMVGSTFGGSWELVLLLVLKARLKSLESLPLHKYQIYNQIIRRQIK